MSLRPRLALGFLLLLALLVPAWATERAPAVEMTFLQAEPGQRDRLRRFIQLNWLAMDRIAVERGLMTSYELFDIGSDEGPWHLVVVVKYPDARGYDGIRDAFEEIRRAHQVVAVDGKVLRDLGRVVGTRRVFPVPPN